LDGESHEGRQEYDEQRAGFLRGLGLTVFRVTNDDVITNLDGVAEAILREIMPKNPSTNPSPQAGRGISA
jgi:very-short-patch-repair endonuclease